MGAAHIQSRLDIIARAKAVLVLSVAARRARAARRITRLRTRSSRGMSSTLVRHVNMENIAVRRGSVRAMARSILRSLRRSRSGRPIVTSRIVQVTDILNLMQGNPPHPWRVPASVQVSGEYGQVT